MKDRETSGMNLKGRTGMTEPTPAGRNKADYNKPTEAHVSLQKWLKEAPAGPQLDIPLTHVSALVLYHHEWQQSPERAAERKELRAKKLEDEKADRLKREEDRKAAIEAKEAERAKKAEETEKARAAKEAEREAKQAEREAKLAEAEKAREEREAERDRKAKEREEKRIAAEAERETKAKEREAKRLEREAEKKAAAEKREAEKAAKAAEKATNGADGDDGSAPVPTPAPKRLKRRTPEPAVAGQSASEF
jgi:hypothetical protein